MTTDVNIFIEGDFDSARGDCEYHVSPTCHPCQIGPEWVYGCRHRAWPQNRQGDFVPIVKCNGNTAKCEIKDRKFVDYYIRGINARIKNAKKKMHDAEKELCEIKNLLAKNKEIE